jgi:hypothetical protein
MTALASIFLPPLLGRDRRRSRQGGARADLRALEGVPIPHPSAFGVHPPQ